MEKIRDYPLGGLPMNIKSIITTAIAVTFLLTGTSAFAKGPKNNCKALPGYGELTAALKAAVFPLGVGSPGGGFGLNMWATVVDRDGIVCQITRTGEDAGDQWPGSRVISAQKANTANSFSLPGLPISTAQLYSAVQPGGSLFGLQFSNPVDTKNAYKGTGNKLGSSKDPLRNKKVGGVNVFGGGLALYNDALVLIGAIGVSGDSSCADHNIAWLTRENLMLDFIPGGLVGGTDNIVYDISPNAEGHPESASGWGHPDCGNAEKTTNCDITGDNC
jgi:uncharacterized protein GlcG (DUF336 family)